MIGTNSESTLARFNRIGKEETEIVNAMVEAQRLADCVVDAAIEWHTSGIDNMDQCFDKAGILGAAIDELIEFRRTMPIVKNR